MDFVRKIRTRHEDLDMLLIIEVVASCGWTGQLSSNETSYGQQLRAAIDPMQAVARTIAGMAMMLTITAASSVLIRITADMAQEQKTVHRSLCCTRYPQLPRKPPASSTGRNPGICTSSVHIPCGNVSTLQYSAQNSPHFQK